MGTTLNAGFIGSTYSRALAGLTALSETTLTPNLPLYRFGNSADPTTATSGPWWIGLSPFEAILGYAKSRNEPLSLVARECLAIDWGWSNVDVLIRVVVKQRLSAWSGTPKTQFVRQRDISGGRRLEPDRRITQLYIPGLAEFCPDKPRRPISDAAFVVISRQSIGNRVQP